MNSPTPLCKLIGSTLWRETGRDSDIVSLTSMSRFDLIPAGQTIHIDALVWDSWDDSHFNFRRP